MPNTGSEAGVGWMYAQELAKRHDVWVITDISRRKSIESFGGSVSPRLRFIYYRPSLIANLGLNSRTAHFIYQLWQLSAWKKAKELDQEVKFDCFWHLTYGVFRQPSSMWRAGKPFIFGPIGGAENAPIRLRKSLPVAELLKESFRDFMNLVCWCQPSLWSTYSNASVIIARTEDTKNCLPTKYQEKITVLPEIGSMGPRKNEKDVQQHDGYLRILFVGRLLGWKGAHIAIRAFSSYIKMGGRGDLTIIGSGPMKANLQSLIKRLGVVERVMIIERIPQKDLFKKYEDFNLFLFPSLHDSGGSVVLESLSFGLPVICLDLGGPRNFIDLTCGIVVGTKNKNFSEVVNSLAVEIFNMYTHPELHFELQKGALKRSSEMTWEKRILEVESKVIESVRK